MPWRICRSTGPSCTTLTDILMLSVLAAICGTGSFVAIARFGQLNEAWLRTLATN